MKKLLLILIIALCQYTTKAQDITLEKTFGDEGYLNLIHLSSGDYFYSINFDKNVLNLYDANDYSLHKTMIFPTIAGYYLNSYVYISEKTFNTDDSIEVIINYDSTTCCHQGLARICTESGRLIKEVKNEYAHPAVVYWMNNQPKLLAGTLKNQQIYNINNPGAINEALLGAGNTTIVNNYYNISVTGVQTVTSIVTITIVGNNTLTGTTGGRLQDHQVNLYPNPAHTFINLAFDLPLSSPGKAALLNAGGEVLKSVDILSGQSSLQVDISNFAKGIYYYRVEHQGGLLFTGKFVVI